MFSQRSVRIALVGMSTVGKSDIAQRLSTRMDIVPVGTPWIDSDQEIANLILGDSMQPGIERIFLTLGREKALERIEQEEINFLIRHTNQENAIFSLGPGMGFRGASWNAFRQTVTLVRIAPTSPKDIRNRLIERMEIVKKQLQENFPDLTNHKDFGCWNVNVLFNEKLKMLSEKDSIKRINDIVANLNRAYAGSSATLFSKALEDIQRLIETNRPN